eukprot:765212-Hanusia_phi.AAC.4
MSSFGLVSSLHDSKRSYLCTGASGRSLKLRRLFAKAAEDHKSDSHQTEVDSANLLLDKQDLDKVKKILYDVLQITYETYANCGIQSENCGKRFDAVINSFSAFRNLCNQFEDDLESEDRIVSFESLPWFEFMLYAQKYFNDATIEVSRMIHTSEKGDFVQIFRHWSISQHDLEVLAQGVNSKLKERISLVAGHCCNFSHALMESSIKHDATIFSVAKIMNESFEAKGNYFLEMSQESLKSNNWDPSCALAHLTQAKSSFDKYHQSLRMQKSVGDEKQIADKIESNSEGDGEDDLKTSLQKLKDLIMEQKSLEMRLTLIQRDIQVQTRILQHEQRCEEILNHTSCHELRLFQGENVQQDIDFNSHSVDNLATCISTFISDSSTSVRRLICNHIIDSLKKEFESVAGLVSEESSLHEAINVNIKVLNLDSEAKESLVSSCQEDLVQIARRRIEFLEICKYLKIVYQDRDDSESITDELAKLVETYSRDVIEQTGPKLDFFLNISNARKAIKGMQQTCWVVSLHQAEGMTTTIQDSVTYALDVNKDIQKLAHIMHDGGTLKDLSYSPPPNHDSQAASSSLAVLHRLASAAIKFQEIKLKSNNSVVPAYSHESSFRFSSAICKIFESVHVIHLSQAFADPEILQVTPSYAVEGETGCPLQHMLSQVEEFQPDLIVAVYDSHSVDCLDETDTQEEYSRDHYRRFYSHCCKLQEIARRLCNEKIIYLPGSTPVTPYDIPDSLKMVTRAQAAANQL